MTVIQKPLVGVLTFHAGLNHGGYLQSYMLCELLKECGCEVRIINYRNQGDWWRQEIRPWIGALKRPGVWWNRTKKWKAFQAAFKAQHRSQLALSHRALMRQKYDIVVTGSDIVWSQDLFGFDSAYFGEVNAKKRIAYATSFGWMPADSDLPEAAITGLKRFDRILVRDETAQRILKNHLGKEMPIVADPTLLGLRKREKMRKQPPTRKELLVYAHSFDMRWEPELSRFCDQENCSLLSTGYATGLPGKLDLSLGPLEWVDRVNVSQAIVTNTYHGVLYAVMSGRPFAYMWSEASYIRVRSFLDSIEASERMIKDPSKAGILLRKPLEERSREILFAFADRSEQLLREAVS